MYTPFTGPRPRDPEPPKQLHVIWRMQGPRSVVVAALYEHPVGRELRVFFEDSEDNVLHTQVGTVDALEAKAAKLRAVMLEQGWLPPIEHRLPPVC